MSAAQAVVVRGGCLRCIDRPCPRSTRPTSISRVPTASQTYLPAGRKHVKALDAEQLTTCGAVDEVLAAPMPAVCSAIARSSGTATPRGASWP